VAQSPVLGGAVVRRELLVRAQGAAHGVVQLHLQTWPNYGVVDAATLADLVRAADAEMEAAVGPSAGDDAPRDRPPRMLVHCSGGAGRSGTFVAAHHVWRQLRGSAAAAPPRALVGELVDGTVRELRAQRHPWMVETPEQFDLIMGALDLLLGRAA